MYYLLVVALINTTHVIAALASVSCDKYGTQRVTCLIAHHFFYARCKYEHDGHEADERTSSYEQWGCKRTLQKAKSDL